MGDCPFLRETMQGRLLCEAAINFGLDLADRQNICGSCKVPSLAEAPHCRNLEVYPYLYVAAGQNAARQVGTTFMCWIDRCVVDPADCLACARFERQDGVLTLHRSAHRT